MSPRVAYTRALFSVEGMPGPTHTTISSCRGIARARGDDFSRELAEHLGTGARRPQRWSASRRSGRVRTLAVCADGAPQPNYEYDFAGTPCAGYCAATRCTTRSDSREESRQTSGKTRRLLRRAARGHDGAVLGHLCAWISERSGAGAPPARGLRNAGGRARRRSCSVSCTTSASARSRVERERRQLRAESPPCTTSSDIIGSSAAHHRLLDEHRPRRADCRHRAHDRRNRHRQGARRARDSCRRSARRQAIHRVSTAPTVFVEAGIASLPKALGFAAGGTIFFDEVAVALAPTMQARCWRRCGPRARKGAATRLTHHRLDAIGSARGREGGAANDLLLPSSARSPSSSRRCGHASRIFPLSCSFRPEIAPPRPARRQASTRTPGGTHALRLARECARAREPRRACAGPAVLVRC